MFLHFTTKPILSSLRTQKKSWNVEIHKNCTSRTGKKPLNFFLIFIILSTKLPHDFRVILLKNEVEARLTDLKYR